MYLIGYNIFDHLIKNIILLNVCIYCVLSIFILIKYIIIIHFSRLVHHLACIFFVYQTDQNSDVKCAMHTNDSMICFLSKN